MNIDFVESLLYYDCELLFEAADADGQRYIAIYDDEYPAASKYVVAPVCRDDLAAFKAGEISLRRLLLAAPGGKWYIANFDTDDGSIPLTLQPTHIAERYADPLSGDYYLHRAATDGSAAQQPETAPAPV